MEPSPDTNFVPAEIVKAQNPDVGGAVMLTKTVKIVSASIFFAFIILVATQKLWLPQFMFFLTGEEKTSSVIVESLGVTSTSTDTSVSIEQSSGISSSSQSGLAEVESVCEESGKRCLFLRN